MIKHSGNLRALDKFRNLDEEVFFSACTACRIEKHHFYQFKRLAQPILFQNVWEKHRETFTAKKPVEAQMQILTFTSSPRGSLYRRQLQPSNPQYQLTSSHLLLANL